MISNIIIVIIPVCRPLKFTFWEDRGKCLLFPGQQKICMIFIASTILMSVIEGVALSVGIRKVIGISAKKQLSTEIVSDTHINNYDTYWISRGGMVTGDGNYLFTCPLQNKPIELIKAKYRSRTIAKRAKRAEIAGKTFTALSNN